MLVELQSQRVPLQCQCDFYLTHSSSTCALGTSSTRPPGAEAPAPPAAARSARAMAMVALSDCDRHRSSWAHRARA